MTWQAELAKLFQALTKLTKETTKLVEIVVEIGEAAKPQAIKEAQRRSKPPQRSKRDTPRGW